MKRDLALKLINQNRKAYDTIAKYFDKTRSYLWPELLHFKKYVNDGDFILDYGCGNGRLVDLFADKKVHYFGVDTSRELIESAKINIKNKKLNFAELNFSVLDDFLELNFEDNFFDKIFLIAVLHHIPSEEFRLKLLLELKRVLKRDGLLIMTNWNLRESTKKNEVLKFNLLKLIGKNKMDFFDVMLPWKSPEGKILAERYYHAFSLNELRKLFKKAGFRVVEDGKIGGKNKSCNLYITAKK